MTIDIYYVRHGDPNYVFDTLTKLGRKQAEQASQVLKDIPFDVVFSSPVKRAKQTACYLTRKTKQKIQVIDFLSEAIAWKHLTIYNEQAKRTTWVYHSDVYLEKLKELQDDLEWYKNDCFPPYFEKGVKEFDKELDEWLLSLNIKHNRETKTFVATGETMKTIVIFAHEGAGTRFFSSILDMNYPKFIIDYPRVDCCSISHLKITLDGTTPIEIMSYNDCRHLK